jgi:hypothetical protein
VSSVTIQKSLHFRATPDCILSCLQDPLFWTFLPTTYRTLDIARRPLAIGDSLRPSIERYRLADVDRDSVTFRSPLLSLRYTAESTDAETSQVLMEIAVEDPCQCTNVLLDETDKTFCAMADLFERQPYYVWLPALKMRFESGPVGVNTRIEATVRIPFGQSEVEDVLVRRPQEFDKWIDSDMQKGMLQVESAWPSIGAVVRYRYPRELWFLPPFGRDNVGTIRLEEWVPGKRIVLSDRTEPGGVRTDRTFEIQSEDSRTTLLRMSETCQVNSWITKTFMGRFIRQAIPVEGAKSLCELAAVVARLHLPAVQLQM